MLEVLRLECVRGDRPLFQDLSFSLRPGELLHVIGRNGAGKTTLLRTLCGLTRPAAGEVRWNGTNIRELGDEFHRQLSYIGHSNGIQGELTPPENLRLAACLASGATTLPTRSGVLERFGLAAYEHFPSKLLSQGQKRRLALARLIVAAKPLWVLDEPLSALDVQSTAMLSDLFRAHVADGGIIVLTSHQDLAPVVGRVLQIRLGDSPSAARARHPALDPAVSSPSPPTAS